MRPRWRRVTATAVVAAAVAAVAVVGSGSLGSAAAAATTTVRTKPLLVVAVPGLLWQDVATMPALRAFTAGAAVGDLSVHAASSPTRCAAGLLTLSAGRRVDAAAGTCTVGPRARVALSRSNLAGSYAARPGAFGQALRDHGVRVAALDRAARLVVGDAAGRVDIATGDETAAFAHAGVVATVLPALYAATGADRPSARAAVDREFARLVAAAPAPGLVALIGASDAATGRPHLHVVALRGGSWVGGALTSVRRAPYVQLVDLAPTLLAALHVPAPGDVDGRVARVGGAAPTVAALAGNDTHAVDASRLSSPLRTVLWVAVLVLALLWAAGRWWQPFDVMASLLAWPLAFAPVVSYLVQVVPWWHGGVARYVELFGAGVAVLAAVTAATTRRRRWPRAAVPAAVTWLVLVVDQLSRAHLQLSAPLGDNPLVAGRFRGMGNIDYAVMASAGVVLAAAVATRLLAAGRRAAAVASVAVVAVVSLAVDGAPPLGDDLGGMLTLLPTMLVALVGVLAWRLTRRRVAALVVAAVAVVVAVAAADYARPADAQTHIGRFVGQVLHGGAGSVLRRKARSSLDTFTNVPAVLAAVSAIGAVAVRRSARRPPGVGALPWWGPVALLTLAVLGSVLNDSGVVVAAFVAVTALPALVVGATAVPTVTPAVATPADP